MTSAVAAAGAVSSATEAPEMAAEVVTLPWERPDVTIYDLSEHERDVTFIQAQHGNLDALRMVFRSMLAQPERGKRILDMPRQVRQELVIAVFNRTDELAMRTCLMKADMLEADLLSEASASPLERLLIQRLVTCWLAAELADMSAAADAMRNVNEYYMRRQDRAHRRFLQSVDALTRMRRLMSPIPFAAAQVNIAAPGGQQINQVNTAALLPHEPSS